MNIYTLEVLHYQKSLIERKLAEALYADEVTFYTNMLGQIKQDIDIIEVNEVKSM